MAADLARAELATRAGNAAAPTLPTVGATQTARRGPRRPGGRVALAGRPVAGAGSARARRSPRGGDPDAGGDPTASATLSGFSWFLDPNTPSQWPRSSWFRRWNLARAPGRREPGGGSALIARAPVSVSVTVVGIRNPEATTGRTSRRYGQTFPVSVVRPTNLVHGCQPGEARFTLQTGPRTDLAKRLPSSAERLRVVT